MAYNLELNFDDEGNEEVAYRIRQLLNNNREEFGKVEHWHRVVKTKIAGHFRHLKRESNMPAGQRRSYNEKKRDARLRRVCKQPYYFQPVF